MIKIEMFWSEEDKEYVVRLQDAPSISALGDSPCSALHEFAFVAGLIPEEFEDAKD